MYYSMSNLLLISYLAQTLLDIHIPNTQINYPVLTTEVRGKRTKRPTTAPKATC